MLMVGGWRVNNVHMSTVEYDIGGSGVSRVLLLV